jgi:hypothetical protein
MYRRTAMTPEKLEEAMSSLNKLRHILEMAGEYALAAKLQPVAQSLYTRMESARKEALKAVILAKIDQWDQGQKAEYEACMAAKKAEKEAGETWFK